MRRDEVSFFSIVTYYEANDFIMSWSFNPSSLNSTSAELDFDEELLYTLFLFEDTSFSMTFHFPFLFPFAISSSLIGVDVKIREESVSSSWTF